MNYLIETSRHMAYVHDFGDVSPDLLRDSSNIPVSEEQAAALVSCSDDVVWCDCAEEAKNNTEQIKQGMGR